MKLCCGSSSELEICVIVKTGDSLIALPLVFGNTGKFEGMEISILSFFHPPQSSRVRQALRNREEKRWIHRMSSVVPRGLNLLD